jgi:hypothetical protein
MIPQKTNNNITEDLLESEGKESFLSDIIRVMIRMSNKLK